MGYSEYSTAKRAIRTETLYHAGVATDTIFTQQKLRMLHDAMNPRGITFRECRDSEAHPNTVPIVLALDVTGSMAMVPDDLIRKGLPQLMGDMIGAGNKDVSLLFLAIGDHEADRCPLQVGQFESGDAELDMWLTRSYLEKGGGGNTGESYLLAWYFAAFHTSTDAFEKRGKKGYLITIGDEPCLRNLPKSAIDGIMGSSNAQVSSYSSAELLEKAREKFHVYHIHVNHGRQAITDDKFNSVVVGWKELIGQNLIVSNDYTQIPKVIANIVNQELTAGTPAPSTTIPVKDAPVVNNPVKDDEILLT